MLKTATKRQIREMVRRLVEQFDPDQVILFGSHARGEAGPDSDVDFLVVLPITGSKAELEIDMGVALHDHGVAVDVIAVTPEEVERRKDIFGTIIYPAIHEGKVLYARRNGTGRGRGRMGAEGRKRSHDRRPHAPTRKAMSR